MSAQIKGTALALLTAVVVWVAGCSDEVANSPPAVTDQTAPAVEERATAPDQQTPGAAATDQEWAEIVASKNPPEIPLGESNLSTDLAIAYEKKCATMEDASLECEILRSLVIAEVVLALEEIERARDQRGTEQALTALDFGDEPEILVAAMRILGQFPDTPGIATKALPLLNSPWLAVQEMAANLLSRSPDPEYRALGSLWSENHHGLYAEVEDEYVEYPDFSANYFDMGFPEYPAAEWFSPADSDRSVGWWTTRELAIVSDWLRSELGVEPLSHWQWMEQSAAQSIAAAESIDQSKMDRVQQLAEEFSKTQNTALLQQIDKLQEEIFAPVQAAGKVAEMGVGAVAVPSTADVFETAQYFIAEEKDGHVARLIIVYPLPSLGHTVIQQAWSLVDYPAAWPPAQAAEE